MKKEANDKFFKPVLNNYEYENLLANISNCFNNVELIKLKIRMCIGRYNLPKYNVTLMHI